MANDNSGVQIPVIIDIEKACLDASKRVKQAMQPLQRAIDNNALNVAPKLPKNFYQDIKNLRVGEISKLFKQGKVSAEQLSEAIEIVKQRLVQMAIAGDTASVQFKNLLQAKVTLENMQKSLIGVRNAIDGTNVALQRQSALWAQVRSLAGMYVSVFGLMRLARDIKSVTAELEYQRVALGHLIQDEEYGKRLFEEIKGLAVESPFRIKDLVTYTKQLAAYRIETTNLFHVTSQLADISAGLGVDMNRLILAYGQVRAASVLRGQELRQFTEAGIPLVELLAEKFSELRGELVTTGDVFKLISERAVPFSMIAEIFEDLTEKGGMFYEMQKTQADTLKGKWEKLKDAFDIGLQSIGESKTARAEMDALLWVMNRLAKNLQIIPKLVTAGVAAWTAYKVATLKAALATKTATTAEQAEIIAVRIQNAQLSNIAVRILGRAKAEAILTKAIQAQVTATNFLARAWAKLQVIMMTHPIAAVLAGVAALAGVLGLYRTRTDAASDATEHYHQVLEKFTESERDFARNERLIQKYETLSQKTDRTAKENNKLHKTMELLKEIFPEVTDKIDDENASLDENVAKLKEKNKEEREKARAESERELQIAKDDLEVLKEKSEELEKEVELAAKQEEFYRKLYDLGIKRLGTNPFDFFISPKTIKGMDDAIKKYKDLKAQQEENNKKLEEGNKFVEEMTEKLYPQEAKKDMKQWQKDVLRILELKQQTGDTPVFTPEEVQGMKSVYDLYGKLKTRVKDLTESLEGLAEAMKHTTNPQARANYVEDENRLKKTLDTANTIKELFGFEFPEGPKGTRSYEKPKFITDMEEAIKFMKDFKKGYDDLRKYIGSEGALLKQTEVMVGRGTALGLSQEEQKRAAHDLSQWYQDMINKTIDEMKRRGAKGNTVNELLGFDAGKNKAIKDFQKLLQSLLDAKTDLDTSNWERSLEQALADLAEKVKRSDAAKKFYDSIFELTGDKDMSLSMSMSVYGEGGQDLRDKMRQQLEQAFVLDAKKIEEIGEVYSEIQEKVRKAIASGDWSELDKYLKYVVDNNRNTAKEVIETWRRESEDVAKSYAKLALKFDEIERQRVNITNKAAKDREAIEKGANLEIAGIVKKYGKEISEAQTEEERRNLENAMQSAIQGVKDRAQVLTEGVISEEEYELSKLTRDYRLFFSTVGVLSKESARRVYEDAKKALTDQFIRGIKTLTQYKKELRELDAQQKKYTKSQNLFVSYLSGGIEGLASKIKDYSEGITGIVATISENKADGTAIFGEGDKEYIDKMGKIFGGKIFGVSGRKNVFDKLIEKTGGDAKKMKEALEDASQAMAAMGEGMAQGIAIADLWVQNIGNAIIELDKLANTGEEAAGWWNDVANIMMKIPTLGLSKSSDAGDRFAEMNEYAMAGFEKFKQGNFVGAFADTIRSWSAMFGPSVKAINREIKKQQDLLDELTYEYNRLDVAIDKAFGESYIYNYNKQLENLVAQQQAYLKQAELERSKGKKKDKSKIKEYEDAARATADQIADMQSQLSEFFSGTDLTSAAEDFATAWIEAYKEFANTTDAMSDKFEDMIQSMITRSLGAKIMQTILQPLFDEIDAMAKDGDLTANEISKIALDAPLYVQKMNDAMTTMANDLAAAGYNLRGSTTNLTGISRDIAGASEESILGLSAAINTQNFYISRVPSIDEKLSQILALMGGGTTQSGAPVTETPETDLKLQYLSYLPTMASDVNEILVNLKRVISPKNASTATHYIAIR